MNTRQNAARSTAVPERRPELGVVRVRQRRILGTARHVQGDEIAAGADAERTHERLVEQAEDERRAGHAEGEREHARRGPAGPAGEGAAGQTQVLPEGAEPAAPPSLAFRTGHGRNCTRGAPASAAPRATGRLRPARHRLPAPPRAARRPVRTVPRRPPRRRIRTPRPRILESNRPGAGDRRRAASRPRRTAGAGCFDTPIGVPRRRGRLEPAEGAAAFVDARRRRREDGRGSGGNHGMRGSA